LTKQQQEQKKASWHLFEKAKAEKKKAYWRGANLYINDTKITAQHQGCWDQRALRVSLWNIHGGINTKLSTNSHIHRLFDDSDVVALTETHLFPDETPLHILGFQCLDNPHPVFDMSSVRATMKHSGGVGVFMNDS